MYVPLEVVEVTWFKPMTSLKRSSAVGFAEERGKSSLANSVARAIKVERGKVTPKVASMRFCTDNTEDRDMGMAISVSNCSGWTGADGAALLGGDGGADFGGAGLALLRSRCPSLEMRADCSEAYFEGIVPR